MDNINKFSDTLLYLRKRDGLSQQELADKIGVSRSLIGMYESGQRMPSFEMLEALADTFNVNIDFLIGRTDTGHYSGLFRNRLAAIVENSDSGDFAASGIDSYELELIINGAIPLTFDTACRLAEEFGETLNSMIGKSDESGEDPAEEYLIDNYRQLNPQGQEYILQTMHMAAQIYKNSDNSSSVEEQDA